MKIMAAMYSEVLGNAGYDVETQLVTTRDVYVPELTKGNVDVVPDYLAGIADYLNTTRTARTPSRSPATTPTPPSRDFSRSPRRRASRCCSRRRRPTRTPSS